MMELPYVKQQIHVLCFPHRVLRQDKYEISLDNDSTYIFLEDDERNKV